MVKSKDTPKKAKEKKPVEKSLLEKTPLSSKKFIAYLLAEFGWKLVLLILLFNVEMSIVSCALMMSIVIISGFVQVGYILGQAAVDKYIRVAQVSSGLLNPGGLKDDEEKLEEPAEPEK